MKLWLAKVQRDGKVGLIPTDDIARAVLARMEDGEFAHVELVRPRSVPWHRMYFGICRSIGENQDPKRDEGSIDYELRILAGHYDVMHVGHRKRPWWLGAVAGLMSGHGRTGDWLLKRISIRLTHHQVLVPRRIAFAKLTADQWAELWPSLELAIREHFGEEYVPEKRAA